MAQISLSNVSVSYPVYQTSRQRSILGYAAHRASFGRIAQDAGKIHHVDALRGVSVELREGDRLAIVGRNGSGKTTILKLFAGLILPDAGSALIRGTRATILNSHAGLDTEKNGFQNIDLIGRLMGVKQKDIKALTEDVAEFTELGDFLNLPVRIYSTGMTIRLLFALATSVEREIVILDEVIGAGDAHFVGKAGDRLRALSRKAKIVILATHTGQVAMQLCNRAMWLDSGQTILEAAPQEVWERYLSDDRPVAPSPQDAPLQTT